MVGRAGGGGPWVWGWCAGADGSSLMHLRIGEMGAGVYLGVVMVSLGRRVLMLETVRVCDFHSLPSSIGPQDERPTERAKDSFIQNCRRSVTKRRSRFIFPKNNSPIGTLSPSLRYSSREEK